MSATSGAAILLVDKPVGLSSAQAVARVQRAVGSNRTGHAGTLDPLASGLLVLCLGEGTKAAAFLHLDEKEYLATARLGIETTTLDAEGDVTTRRDPSGVTEEAARNALAAMRGAQLQLPPMYSAVHKDGRRLYELAREGVEVERAPRPILVREIELTGFRREPMEVDFRVACSKGTYVRALAADLGSRLGIGAHLGALRRTRAGAFSIEQAVPLERVAEEAQQGTLKLVDPADALAALLAVRVDEALERRVRCGQIVTLESLCAPSDLNEELVRLILPSGRLLAVGQPNRALGLLRLVRVFNYGLTERPS